MELNHQHPPLVARPARAEHGLARLGRLAREELNGVHPRIIVLQALLAALPPYAGGRIRAYALRLAGFQIGRGTLFWGMPTLSGPADLHRRLVVGEDSHFNVGCFFDLEAPITIGDRVGIGHEVMILTSSHRIGSHERRAEQSLLREPVTIEDGAWVGARAVILPGVTIGAGAVVAAGTVVNRSLAPDTMLAGKERVSLARWR